MDRQVAVDGAIETVVADAEAGAQGSIPQVARTRLTLRAVGCGDIRDTREDILVIRHRRVGGLALGQRGQAHVDIPIGSFEVVRQSPLRVRGRHRLFGEIGGPSGGRPVPSAAAGLATIVEVVEGDELARETVMVRRQRLGQQRQLRVAVADLEVAKDLVVAAILLDDINDVPDVAT